MAYYLSVQNILLCICLYVGINAINWNGKDWAIACDFRANDLKNVRIRGEDCSGECARTDACTHFSWTPWKGGTCWLKKGRVSKKDAVSSSDSKTVCGVVRKGSSTQTGNSRPSVQANRGNNLIEQHQFNCIFNQLDSSKRARRWQGLQEALAQVPFKPQNRDEIMIFLSHVSHETDGLKTYQEYCSQKGTCNNYQSAPWCSNKAKPGKQYYGRGWFQLSYPCNYEAAGKALGVDLLNHPDQVATSDKLACATALWFWNERKMNVPARKGDFGATTRIINTVECGDTPHQRDRVNRYQQVRKCFGLGPATNQLRC